MSAWVNGPDRGLDSLVLDDTPAPREATFSPTMISSPVLRDTVVSSGYGSAVPEKPQVVKHKDPDEYFEPKLEEFSGSSAAELRKAVPSSGYGRGDVPQKKKWKKKKRPDFKPIIQRSPVGQRMYDEAPSNRYGKKIATLSLANRDDLPARKSAQETFNPTHSGSKKATIMRRKSISAGYGKAKEVPLSPRQRRSQEFEPCFFDSMVAHSGPTDGMPTVQVARGPNSRSAQTSPHRRLSSHTLLEDRAPEAEPEWEPEIPFVLDCERVASHLYPMTKHGLSLKYIQVAIPDQVLAPSPLKEQFEAQAQTAGYGTERYELTVDDERRKEMEDREIEPTWNLTKETIEQLSHQLADTEMSEEAQEEKAATAELFSHVGSSQYGEAFPDTIPRGAGPEPPGAYGPWLATKGTGIPTLTDDLPDFNSTYDQVASCGYGRVSPEKAYRKEREPAPVWVPNNGVSAEFPAVEHAPTNKYQAKVRTQYDHAVNVY